MHFCQDERAATTAAVKASAGADFKQPMVMTKLDIINMMI